VREAEDELRVDDGEAEIVRRVVGFIDENVDDDDIIDGDVEIVRRVVGFVVGDVDDREGGVEVEVDWLIGTLEDVSKIDSGLGDEVCA
jgi:hypothetical protein